MQNHNANGDVSAYGLACGIPQTVERVTESGIVWSFTLSHNGVTYDVHAGPVEASHDWAQFELLGDARAFLRRILAKNDSGLVRGSFVTQNVSEFEEVSFDTLDEYLDALS
jgi:hypothetical protein